VLGPQMQQAFGTMLNAVRARQDALGPAGASLAATTTNVVVMAGAGALLVGVILAVLIGRGLSGVIKSIAARMRQLADGDLELELDDKQRHEVGQMIEALTVFRDNGKAMRAMDKEKEASAARVAREHQTRTGLQAEVQQVG